MIGKQVLGGVLLTAVAGTSVASANMWQDNPGQGLGRGFGQGDQENRQEMNQILEDGDYDAWKSHMEEMGRDKIVQEVTEEDFAKMVEMHQAMEDGDFEKAKEIRDELGLPIGRPGNGKGMRGHAGCGVDAPWFQDLSDEVKAELKEAQDAGDREKVREILDENGIKPGFRANKSENGLKNGNGNGRSS